jgi:DNA-directed RNA polymerases I, II, and III subunit RPABC5
MIIPIRCFTCAKVIANKFEPYEELLREGVSISDAFQKLQLKRYCCKRMILTHVQLCDKLIKEIKIK